jgi:hypothetical protein
VRVALVASRLHEPERIPTLRARPQVRNLGNPCIGRHLMHVGRRARGAFLVDAGGDILCHVSLALLPARLRTLLSQVGNLGFCRAARWFAAHLGRPLSNPAARADDLLAGRLAQLARRSFPFRSARHAGHIPWDVRVSNVRSKNSSTGIHSSPALSFRHQLHTRRNSSRTGIGVLSVLSASTWA